MGEDAEWLRAGGAIPNEAALKQELATPIFWFDAQGRRVLESKDEIKKRLAGGASPDIADALALTFAMPVGKRDPYEELLRLRTRKHREPYHPLRPSTWEQRYNMFATLRRREDPSLRPRSPSRLLRHRQMTVVAA